MRLAFPISVATLVAVASACAAHGPFSQPLAVVDTTNLPNAHDLPTPPMMKGIHIPGIIQWMLRDTIEIRYVVDTTGRTDPRTFIVVRGHDSRYISFLKDHIRTLLYTPGRTKDGTAARAWMTAVMQPRPGVTEGGMNFTVMYR